MHNILIYVAFKGRKIPVREIDVPCQMYVKSCCSYVSHSSCSAFTTIVKTTFNGNVVLLMAACFDSTCPILSASVNFCDNYNLQL